MCAFSPAFADEAVWRIERELTAAYAELNTSLLSLQINDVCYVKILASISVCMYDARQFIHPNLY